MSRRKLASTLLALLLAIAWIGNRRGSSSDNTAAPSVPQTVVANAPPTAPLRILQAQRKYEGVHSCSATACHGSGRAVTTGSIQRNEYVTWFEQDPHAKAFQVLRNEVSQRMMRNLGLDIAATEHAQCLKCHSPLSQATHRGQRFYGQHGVSCEDCHGAAGDWIRAHYRAGWEDRDVTQTGMLDTKTLDSRARICARCHVGAVDGEVNHDLIAAGHPVMKFEFSAYHDALPKHWKTDPAENRPAFHTRLWKAGQQAAAAGALTLLELRASKAESQVAGAIWPELSEYDCFSCHRDLPRRLQNNTGTATTSRWGSWYSGLLERGSTQQDSALSRLRMVMERSVVAEPKEVLREVRLAIDQLQATEISFDYVRRASQSDSLDWDSIVQLYLAIRAHDQDSRQARPPNGLSTETQERIDHVRRLLQFPDTFVSPRGFRRPRTEQPSPRVVVIAALRDLVKVLETEGRTLEPSPEQESAPCP